MGIHRETVKRAIMNPEKKYNLNVKRDNKSLFCRFTWFYEVSGKNGRLDGDWEFSEYIWFYFIKDKAINSKVKILSRYTEENFLKRKQQFNAYLIKN